MLPWSRPLTMSVPKTSTLQLLALLWRPINLNWKLPQASTSLVPYTKSKSSTRSKTFLLISLDRFVSITPLYTPTSSGNADNIFITQSYDATSPFETVVDDVQDIWKRVIGSDLV